ncbi:MAG: endolytic transglycosylase MltG [Ichthyobacteriaceae bacterium]|nr:endolytic transglycosylase MltG [Ichthyobacteriaceae bacterium]
MKKILLLLAVFVIIGGVVAGYFYNRIYNPNVKIENEKSTYIYVEKDADFKKLVNQLTPYLKDKSSFIQLAKFKKFDTRVKPGKYEIKNGWSNNDLINYLRLGNQIEVKLVFNTVDTVEELAGKVSRQIDVDSNEVLKAILNPEFLKKNNLTKQNVGSLFIPNTYNFYFNTTAQEFLTRMEREYNRFWNNDRLQKAKALKLTSTEVSILASIVQKETVKSAERRDVAGLYLNRLRDGWKLQSDPTVVFALEQKADNNIVVRRVLYKDLEIDSPYNTYKNHGLPPGPITIPEIDAIDAVLNHSEHKYYYMCASSVKFGYHEFARGSRGHAENRRKYINWLNKQGIKR